MKYLLFIFGCLVFLQAQTKEVRIYGENLSFSGKELVFLSYSDPITQTPIELARCNVKGDGKFKIILEIDKTSYVYIETGINHLYFYAEPEGVYQLVLPNFSPLSEVNILNPYFELEKIHLGIKGMKPKDLNYLIMDFDYFYTRYLDEKLVDIFAMGKHSDVDTFINEISTEFSYSNNEFFETYKKFRLEMLRYIAYERNVSEITFKYFRKYDVCYNNPAYTDLFRKLYTNFLDDELLQPEGPVIYRSIVYGHSIKSLKKILSLKMELSNNRFKELVILQGIHDAFYNTNFAWTPLLLTLDSLCIATPYEEHRAIGQHIADKILNMASGTLAPNFSLPDTAGTIYSLRDFKQEFVYLNFINTESYSAKQELPLLKILHSKHDNYFKIVTIITDTNKEKAMRFIHQNKYNWTFLFANEDDEILKNYKVVAFPSYYLVGPANELILSPAPGPNENFERVFFSIIRQ